MIKSLNHSKWGSRLKTRRYSSNQQSPQRSKTIPVSYGISPPFPLFNTSTNPFRINQSPSRVIRLDQYRLSPNGGSCPASCLAYPVGGPCFVAVLRESRCLSLTLGFWTLPERN
ncbi:hypothetical protein BDV32DRAFT_133944 [Aspergillus pseudonomiae]|nr:hypothetical protein BDV32DRAFT_133944 [Aspergillus pseudonomiae]